MRKLLLFPLALSLLFLDVLSGTALAVSVEEPPTGLSRREELFETVPSNYSIGLQVGFPELLGMHLQWKALGVVQFAAHLGELPVRSALTRGLRDSIREITRLPIDLALGGLSAGLQARLFPSDSGLFFGVGWNYWNPNLEFEGLAQLTWHQHFLPLKIGYQVRNRKIGWYFEASVGYAFLLGTKVAIELERALDPTLEREIKRLEASGTQVLRDQLPLGVPSLSLGIGISF